MPVRAISTALSAAILTAGLAATAGSATAASVAVTSGPNGTVIVDGQPCRVVVRKHEQANPQLAADRFRSSGDTASTDRGAAASVEIIRGAASSSVVVGTGSDANSQSAAAGSDCVIYRTEK